MNLLTIDFEYKGTNEKNYDLVCAAYGYYKEGSLYAGHAEWLYRDPIKYTQLKDFLKRIRDKVVIVCFNAEAEARCFLSLGLDPTKFQWIDLQAEWRLITNHHNEYRHGEQLIQGKVKKTRPRKHYHDTGDFSKPDNSLLACTYKMIGKEEDLDHKKEMVGKILNSKEYSEELKAEIIEYCSSDISNLKDIFDAYLVAFEKLYGRKWGKETYLEEAMWRGETVARAAVMSWTGYPIDGVKLKNFTKNVPLIIKEVQEDINSQFPNNPPFSWVKSTKRYKENQKELREWVTENHENWEETEKGKPSLALDAWEEHYHYRHDYPRENLGAQMLRYKRLLQSLNGFRPKALNAKDKRTIKDFLDTEPNPRVHPFIQPYGSQTGRYQPSSIGFLFLKAAWVRSLCMPRKGRMIVGCDYKSEEFLIAGLISKDKAMIEAYKTGDVYLAFAKQAGAVPKNGTRKKYAAQRDRFKSTVLGVSYGMQSKSLAKKITQDTGKECSEAEAQKLIDLFFKVYKRYAKFREKLIGKYQTGKNIFIKSHDGWTLWGHQYNERSVLNWPIQTRGSDILRLAVRNTMDRKLTPLFPLHDALYLEGNSFDWEYIDQVAQTMKESFVSCFPGQEEEASLIKVDLVAWSPDYNPTTLKTPGGNEVEIKREYIDPRSKKEYDRLNKYFYKLN